VNDFVDRFLGLVYHVVQHTATMRGYPLKPEDKEDIAADSSEDRRTRLRTLAQFRGKSSLASYLTVIARRTCVNDWRAHADQGEGRAQAKRGDRGREAAGQAEAWVETLEEVGKLLKKLRAASAR